MTAIFLSVLLIESGALVSLTAEDGRDYRDIEAHFHKSNTLLQEKTAFRGVLRRGFNQNKDRRTLCRVSTADPTCARRERDVRGLREEGPELTRWGPSMLDLFHTLQDFQAWDVSLVAQTGLRLIYVAPKAR